MKRLIFLIALLLVQGISWAKPSEIEVYKLLLKHEVKHPRIVMKQLLHESGHLTSYSTRHRKNVLGIFKGTKQRRFKSIEHCIVWYKNHIQNKYKGGDYYTFLKKRKYCPDRRYIGRVKRTKIKTKSHILDGLEKEYLCMEASQGGVS